MIKKVCITIDDLPCSEDNNFSYIAKVNNKIIHTLDRFNIKSTAFVNEEKLFKRPIEYSKHLDLLNLWLKNGHLLGNHGYSHLSLSKISLNSAKKDVLDGEKHLVQLLTKYNIPLKFYRHPYLDTGNNELQFKQFDRFLHDQGYIVAPVTMDSDCWLFNSALLKSNNTLKSSKIKIAYLKHLGRVIDYYENAAKQIFGYYIPQILLLHANYINSILLHDVIKIFIELGYQFIGLEEAIKDKAYSTKNNFFSSLGISWLYRWDYSKDQVVDWSQRPIAKSNQILLW